MKSVEGPAAPAQLPAVGSVSQFQCFFAPSPGAAAEECAEGFESLQPVRQSFIRNKSRHSCCRQSNENLI